MEGKMDNKRNHARDYGTINAMGSRDHDHGLEDQAPSLVLCQAVRRA
jgi:hypothetical protein